MGNISPETSQNIAIIGDGYSAAILVYYLLKNGIKAPQITIFGQNPLGQGQAYASSNKYFRLNIRADLMIVDKNKPDGFGSWAVQNIDDPKAHHSAGDFYQRADFARYIDWQVREASGGKIIGRIEKKIVGLEHNDGWKITAEDGTKYQTDSVIIATGNPPPAAPFPIDAAAQSQIITEVWRGDWGQNIDENADIAIIGSGLTAMDAIAVLADKKKHGKHKGKISVIAPHGKLPPPQQNWQSGEAFIFPPIKTASQFAAVFLKELPRNNINQPQWQSRLEAMRVGINKTWRQLPYGERKRLMQRFGWLWNLIRYRASPQTNDALNYLQKSGQFTIIKGRVIAINKPENGLIRLDLQNKSLECGQAIVATGRGIDPLLRTLARRGIIGQDTDLVDDNLNIIGGNGTSHHNAFALGPPTAMSRGDVIGISAIARQAVKIAEKISQKNKREQYG